MPAVRVPILCYHWFTDPSIPPGVSPEFGMAPDDFRRQMKWLVDSGYTPISTASLADGLFGRAPLPPQPVLVTFDDAYEDFFDHAVPVLLDLRMPATLFVVADRVGQTNTWDRRFGEPERRLLDWPRLREIARHGIELGSHSATHPDMRAVTDAQLVDECSGSKQRLEEGLDQACRFFAYPHGRFDARVKSAVAAAGYEVAQAVLLRLPDLFRSDQLCLMRAIIHADKTFENFRLRTWLAAPWHRLRHVA